MGERIDELLFMSEIRSTAGDALWLSPSYGDGALAIHFSWKKQPEAVDAITREIERQFRAARRASALGQARPTARDAITGLYPRLADFRRLAARVRSGRRVPQRVPGRARVRLTEAGGVSRGCGRGLAELEK